MNIPHSILREEAGGGAAAGGSGAAAGAGAGAAAAGAAGAAGADAGAAAAAPAPFYKGLYGDDGKIDRAAFDRLPDHLKPHADVFKKYETIDALLSGFGNAHAMGVKKALAPLPADAPPEVVAERKAHLDTINNVPKDPKGYGIARPADFPAEHWNDELAGQLASVAQKHSLSPAAVKDLLALQVGATKAEIAKGQQIETEYFAGQDKAYNEAVAKQGLDPEKAGDLTTRGALTLGIDPKSPIFKNAEVRLACLRVANLVAEDKLVTGGDGDPAKPGNELALARDIIQNPANPDHKAWADPNDPRCETVRARVNELYRIDGERKNRAARA